MRLYLIQHGLSLPEEKDPEKSLSPEGKEQTKKIAEFLREKNIKVDNIWHSPKKRSVQSAQIYFNSISCSEIQERGDLNPLDSVDKFPEEIQLNNKDLMIVGHLPFLQKLASLLLAGSENYQFLSFRNFGIVCLEYLDIWKLEWMIIPQFI
ncbi:MAG: phosphohistidine phosphatase SixA [Candidatus Aminicenantes bacterium]|nr:phosphohistidine phosphatase SixA [Candidatus Aminicenantes bacterium]